MKLPWQALLLYCPGVKGPCFKWLSELQYCMYTKRNTIIIKSHFPKLNLCLWSKTSSHSIFRPFRLEKRMRIFTHFSYFRTWTIKEIKNGKYYNEKQNLGCHLYFMTCENYVKFKFQCLYIMFYRKMAMSIYLCIIYDYNYRVKQLQQRLQGPPSPEHLLCYPLQEKFA